MVDANPMCIPSQYMNIIIECVYITSIQDPPPYESQCELASEPTPSSPVGAETISSFPAAIAESNDEALTPIAESQPSSTTTVTGTLFTTTTQNFAVSSAPRTSTLRLFCFGDRSVEIIKERGCCQSWKVYLM